MSKKNKIEKVETIDKKGLKCNRCGDIIPFNELLIGHPHTFCPNCASSSVSCSNCIHYDTCFIQFNLHRYETFFKKDDIAKICREYEMR
jgi:plasmid rolling circle replication initiator protein Rep